MHTSYGTELSSYRAPPHFGHTRALLSGKKTNLLHQTQPCSCRQTAPARSFNFRSVWRCSVRILSAGQTAPATASSVFVLQNVLRCTALRSGHICPASFSSCCKKIERTYRENARKQKTTYYIHYSCALVSACGLVLCASAAFRAQSVRTTPHRHRPLSFKKKYCEPRGALLKQ